MKKRILVVEPYYGGSHEQFLLGLRNTIEADFTFITLPARKWKLRMQLSAPWFFNCIQQMQAKYFDTVLCSTFVDVAVLKALLDGLKDWNPACEFCTYFHENQAVYPSQAVDRSYFQFLLINFTTALVSDRLAFNSRYNWMSFFESCKRYIYGAADVSLRKNLSELENKVTILYPGQDFEGYDSYQKTKNTIPVICWNHRWEHDKNPEAFFRALYDLEKLGYQFRVVLLGQTFRTIPSCFLEAQGHFGRKIIHYGYVPSRTDYIRLLKSSDIVVSTSLHEFFGVSVVEAVHSGCIPLVPDRLSYPELYPQKYRYREGELVVKLAQYLDDINCGESSECEMDTEQFSWKTLKREYSRWLLGADE